MSKRRILSLWFPRFGAERLLRRNWQLWDQPFVVVEDCGQMQVLSSLSKCASEKGVQRGQPLRDAQAICPTLAIQIRDKQAEELLLRALTRWARKFSPLVAIETHDSIILDITGCAHLFGGETKMVEQVQQEVLGLGFSLCIGLADTLGAAWALSHYTGQEPQSYRNGDSIDQEARATRSRASKRRHWKLRDTPSKDSASSDFCKKIAAPGKNYSALKMLPVAALRIENIVAKELNRLGLRRIGDLCGQPRAALTRRFGKQLVEQLDKALGSIPEPISVLHQNPHFGVRMSLPEPIGVYEDIVLTIDRILPRLCENLKTEGRSLRRVRLHFFHTDNTVSYMETGLARPSYELNCIRPLILMKLNEMDAGFGIDMIRLEAIETEAVNSTDPTRQIVLQAALENGPPPTAALDDLISRIGCRIGLENITRYHPADSHIPEKEFHVLAAAWSDPTNEWPTSSKKRPLLLWKPEPVRAPKRSVVPKTFKWRGRTLSTFTAQGPERIAPEWWIDDPNWRSGVRDYWQINCKEGDLLWLFYAHGTTISAGWFCQGSFT